MVQELTGIAIALFGNLKTIPAESLLPNWNKELNCYCNSLPSRLVRSTYRCCNTLFGNPKIPSEFGIAANQAAVLARLILLPLEDLELWNAVLKYKATSFRVWDLYQPRCNSPRSPNTATQRKGPLTYRIFSKQSTALQDIVEYILTTVATRGKVSKGPEGTTCTNKSCIKDPCPRKILEGPVRRQILRMQSHNYRMKSIQLTILECCRGFFSHWQEKISNRRLKGKTEKIPHGLEIA